MPACVGTCQHTSHAARGATLPAFTARRVTLRWPSLLFIVPLALALLCSFVSPDPRELSIATASMQQSREERARSAAQKAADELNASRRDHKAHETTAPISPRGGRGGGGILGSVQESARYVMGTVRSTFSGAGAGAGGVPREDDDSATAATAAGSYAAEGRKEETGGMAVADAAKGKAAEAKDAATAAMESAKEYAAEKKEGARQALAGDAVGRKGETDESAWQQGQDVRRRAAERAQEEARRAHDEPPPSEEDKGRAATENIYGMAMGAMGGAFGEKMVMPTDVVEKKRAEAAGGGGEAAALPSPPGIGDDEREPEEDDVMLRVKAADQMTGQAFNDVGTMGEEGTGMPRQR